MQLRKSQRISAYHVLLYHALLEAVEEYKDLHKKTTEQPKLTEETATPPLIKLHHRVEQARAKAVLLSASCIEALANLYIALRATPEQFEVLERMKFVEKWTVVPSFFVPAYVLPRDTELYQDLKRVCDRRNALVHLKSEVMKDEVLVHKGSPPPSADDEPVFLGRCATLPKRLLKHVSSFDKADDLLLIFTSLAFEWPSDEELDRIEKEIKKRLEDYVQQREADAE